MIFSSLLLMAGAFLAKGSLQAKQLIVYSAIPGRTPSDQYTARVREVGTAQWQEAFVVQTKSKDNPNQKSKIKGPQDDNGYFDNLKGWSASYIAIEFEGMEVEVEVARIGGPITKAKVRPVADAGAAAIAEGKARFVLSKNANVNIDINGQNEDFNTGEGYSGPPVHTFTVFGNPIYAPPNGSEFTTIRPGDAVRSLDRAARKFLKFGPGVHHIGKAVPLVEGGVIYIPGDAIVHGTFLALDEVGGKPETVNYWRVYGSGAVSGETFDWYGDGHKATPNQAEAYRNRPFAKDASGVTMEGFVLIDPANHTLNLYNSTWTKATNQFSNLKILGWRKNSDGINAYNNSVIRDCFFKIQDDCFYLGRNVRLFNNTVWNDANGCVIMVNNASDGTVVDGLKVIYHRGKWHDWAGGRLITFRLLKSDIGELTVRNVVIEDPLPSFAPFLMRLHQPDANNVRIGSMVFENIRQEAREVGRIDLESTSKKEITVVPQNQMHGASITGRIQNITFRNFYYAGKYARSLEDAQFVTYDLVRKDGKFERIYNQFVDHASIKFVVDQD